MQRQRYVIAHGYTKLKKERNSVILLSSTKTYNYVMAAKVL